MSKIMGIEISEDEELMAEDMGLRDYIETEEDERKEKIEHKRIMRKIKRSASKNKIIK